MDWEQVEDLFEADGSLVDLYVHDATLEDWRRMLALIFDGTHGARLLYADEPVPLPEDTATLFEHGHYLGFLVAGMQIDCHFFGVDPLELTLDPGDVNAQTLPHLLAWMRELGDAIGKPVVFTGESSPDLPLLRYDPRQKRVIRIPLP